MDIASILVYNFIIIIIIAPSHSSRLILAYGAEGDARLGHDQDCVYQLRPRQPTADEILDRNLPLAPLYTVTYFISGR